LQRPQCTLSTTMKILKIKLKKGRKKENGKMGPLETIL
jgi:uncharacterized protein Veg